MDIKKMIAPKTYYVIFGQKYWKSFHGIFPSLYFSTFVLKLIMQHYFIFILVPISYNFQTNSFVVRNSIVVII